MMTSQQGGSDSLQKLRLVASANVSGSALDSRRQHVELLKTQERRESLHVLMPFLKVTSCCQSAPMEEQSSTPTIDCSFARSVSCPNREYLASG